MRARAITISFFSICLLFASCKKLKNNDTLSSVFLEQLSASNQVTPLANEIVQITSLPTFGSGGIFLSYSFPDGTDIFDYFDVVEPVDEGSTDLFDNFISNVISNEKGDLWVLTYETLERYISQEEIWVSYHLPEDRYAEPIAISIQQDGGVLCVNKNHILLFTDGVFEDLNLSGIGGPGDNGLRGGTTDVSNSTWIHTPDGILVLDQNNGTLLFQIVKAVSPNEDYKNIDLRYVESLTQDGLGYIWMSNSTELISYNGAKWEYFQISDNEHLDGSIRAMEMDQDGNIWVLSGSKLVHIGLNGIWKSYFIDISYEELESIDHLYIDADQQVWLIGNSGSIQVQIDN